MLLVLLIMLSLAAAQQGQPPSSPHVPTKPKVFAAWLDGPGCTGGGFLDATWDVNRLKEFYNSTFYDFDVYFGARIAEEDRSRNCVMSFNISVPRGFGVYMSEFVAMGNMGLEIGTRVSFSTDIFWGDDVDKKVNLSFAQGYKI
jgi:hypothetical protein